jgi:hypothetical protein
VHSLNVLLIRVSRLSNNYFKIYSHADSMLGNLIKEMNNSSCAYEFSLSLFLTLPWKMFVSVLE